MTYTLHLAVMLGLYAMLALAASAAAESETGLFGKLIDTGVTALYGVYVADSMVVANASAKTPQNSKGLAEFPVREKISVAEGSSLDKESIFNVLVSFTPGLRHIYSIRYLK